MPFQKGQSGNPGGRPSKARQELEFLLETVFTVRRRRAVLDRLVADAETGDHAARTLLLAYTYGKPVERLEHSGPDGAVIPLEVVELDYRTAIADVTE